MHIAYTLFIALANNIDNIGVRIAYSIKGIKISNKINLWISVITFLISTLAALFGEYIADVLSKKGGAYISMGLLTAIGIWMIAEPFVRKIRLNKVEESEQLEQKGLDTSIKEVLMHPEKADTDHSNNIDFKEATLLGIALSLNNIGGGLSAGMIGLNSVLVGLLSAALSFIALWLGNYITDFFAKWKLEKKATIFAGLLLIAIGIKQIL